MTDFKLNDEFMKRAAEAKDEPPANGAFDAERARQLLVDSLDIAGMTMSCNLASCVTIAKRIMHTEDEDDAKLLVISCMFLLADIMKSVKGARHIFNASTMTEEDIKLARGERG